MQVWQLWDSMSQLAMKKIEKGLVEIEDDEKLLRIKHRVALFVQTMEVSRCLNRCCRSHQSLTLDLVLRVQLRRVRLGWPHD